MSLDRAILALRWPMFNDLTRDKPREHNSVLEPTGSDVQGRKRGTVSVGWQLSVLYILPCYWPL